MGSSMDEWAQRRYRRPYCCNAGNLGYCHESNLLDPVLGGHSGPVERRNRCCVEMWGYRGGAVHWRLRRYARNLFHLSGDRRSCGSSSRQTFACHCGDHVAARPHRYVGMEFLTCRRGWCLILDRSQERRASNQGTVPTLAVHRSIVPASRR